MDGVRTKLLAVVAFSMFGAGVALAQDQSSSGGADPGLSDQAAVKIGEYRDLTFMRQVKLGTAPFVNPGLLQSSEIAYKYDAAAAAKTNAQELVRLLQTGQVGLAKRSDATYTFVQPTSDIWRSFYD